jgi:hypothetical protein
MDPDVIWNLLEELRVCVCLALDETECLCPCYTMVAVGDVIIDNCCEGFLYVTADRIYPTESFPVQDTGPVACSNPLAVDITVGILRCAPIMTENGDFPTPQEISDAAKITYTDAFVATTALICCLAATKRSRQFSMRGTTFVGPDTCQGVEISLTVELTNG